MNINKDFLKFFKWNAGPSFFYIMSAACVLLGVSMITIPLYESSDLLGKRFYLVGIINLYEIALLVVSLLICFWKKGNDDAISLVCLLGIFLIGSTISLDTVSVEFAQLTLIIGVVGFVFVFFKLYFLSKKVLGSIDIYLFIAILFILLPNFIMPGTLGFFLKNSSNQTLQNIWSVGWGSCLFSGGFLLFVIFRMSAQKISAKQPFLCQQPMHLIFAAILFGGTCCHQFTLNFAFDLGMPLGSFSFILILVMFFGIEYKRVLGKKLISNDLIWLLSPIGLYYLVVYNQSFHLSFWNISYPFYGLVVASAIFGIYFIKRRQVLFLHLCFSYFSASVVIINGNISINAILYLISFISIFIAIYTRNISWTLISSVLIPLCILYTTSLKTWAKDINLAQSYILCLLLGLSFLIAYGFFRKKLHWIFAVISSSLVALGTLGCFANIDVPALNQPLAFGFCTVLAGVIYAIWLKEIYSLLPMVYPLLANITPTWKQCKEVIPDNKGWIVIFVSFLLLGFGILSSLAKVKFDKPENKKPLSTR